MTRFLCSGSCEGVKGSVHAVVGLLLVLCTGYNFFAYRQRQEKHLRRNAVIYFAGAIYEGVQVARHCRGCSEGE